MIRSVLYVLASVCTWYGWTRFIGQTRGMEWLDIPKTIEAFKDVKIRESIETLSGVEIAFSAVALIIWLAVMLSTVLIPLWLVQIGTLGRGFWAMVSGCIGASLFSLMWFNALGPSLGPAVLLSVLAAFFWIRVIVSALSQGFHSADGAVEIEVKDGIVSLTAGNSVRAFPKGFIEMTQHREQKSWQETAGGPQMSTRSVPVYGSDGSFGTAHVPVVLPGEYYQVTRSRSTGRTEFTFKELSPDHALKIATKPAGVSVLGRTGGTTSLAFALSGVDRLRFDYWCRLHASAFFHASGDAARRIKKATRSVTKEVTKKRGKPRRSEILFNHLFQLEKVLAIYDDGIFVRSDTGETPIDAFVPVKDVIACFQNGHLEIEGRSFAVSPDIAIILERWVRVAALKIANS